MSVYNTGEESISIGKVSDLDRERFFRMALNEETEVNSLLAYYRDRINEFDTQREDWLAKYNKIRTPQDEAHKQEWELQKRREEVAELQHTLEEGKLHLYNERQEIMDLIKENDQLKLKELEDRKKINELMLLGEPVEQEVVFYKDVKPETITRYMKNDLSLRTNKNYEAMLQKTGGKDIPQKVALTSKTGRGVVKTIYLPNDQMNTVALENEELKARLDEDRAACLAEAEVLREQLRNTENELYAIYENNQEQIREYLKKNEVIEKENINLVKDYYELILESNAVERKINEENELLRLKNAALANKLRIQVKKAMTDSKSAQQLVDRRSDEFNSKYRQELRQKEEDLNLIKDQYAQIQQIYLQKMKELEGHLTKLAKKHSTLEKRRLLENEGFRTDVKRMRSRLVEYQRHLEKVSMSYPQKRSMRNGGEEEGLEERDAEAAREAKQELDLIKKQVNDLEMNLEKARKVKS